MFKPTTMVWQPTASAFFKLSLLTSAFAALGLTAGCSSTPTTSKVQTSNTGMLDANSLDSLEDLLSATDMRAVEGDRLLILKHGDVWKRMSVGFKMDENHWDPRIDAQRSWFAARQPYIDRLSARASRYLYHTVKEAERRGLPTELALLPIIESSYDPAATSSAAAAGMWQFIPSTGKIYGLRQTSLYDGRRDVVESTRAAYEFLGGLYNQFGSWELALAAYNAGPGRIQQAINRNQAAGLPTDYWSLRLPQETMNYVPRFLAVAQIVKSPSKYGVSLPPIANRPHFREVSVPAGAQLNQIASIAGLSRAELYALNPGHRGEVVDSNSTLRILIPSDLSPTIDNKLKALKPSYDGGLWASNSPSTATQTLTPTPVAGVTQSITPAKVAPPVLTTNNSKPTINTPPTSTASPLSVLKITPQNADALAKFAAGADVPSAPRIPVAVTPAMNVKPVAIEPPISAQEKAKILAAVKAEGEKETVKQVLEPQATQAEKEEVVKEIKAIAPQGTEVLDPYDGKIRLTAIQTSQSVANVQGKENTVGFAYPKGLADTTPSNSEEAKLNKDKNFKKTESEVVVEPPKGKRSTYTVLAGDTLATIALKNGVNWRDIAKWNQVDPNGTLFVGATLYLYDAKPQVDAPSSSKKSTTDTTPTAYVVKPNDSLTSVASAFDLSVSQLASYNNLNANSNLFVGQKLKLKDSADDKLAEINKTVVRADTTKPVAKIKTKVYQVKRGEYLKVIADRYALSVHELADLTPGLDISSSLYVGQKINVPINEVKDIDPKLESKVIDQSKFKNVKAETEYKTENYKVQRGDTLSSIAIQSKLTLSELAELNKISPSKSLLVGQTIKIPEGSTTPDSYTVQAGDSLTAVANKYNLQVSQVADLNGLNTTSGLFVGQKLKLSGEPEASVKDKAHSKNEVKAQAVSKDVHVVQSGETLAVLHENISYSFLI